MSDRRGISGNEWKEMSERGEAAAYWDARKNLLVSVPNAQTFIVMNIPIRITTTGMLKQNKAFILIDSAEITSDHTYSFLILVLRK